MFDDHEAACSESARYSVYVSILHFVLLAFCSPACRLFYAFRRRHQFAMINILLYYLCLALLFMGSFAASRIQREMYSKANLQHLGERHEPLSNLTWVEGLLIARIHPVISVVTITATDLLCYAGYVCNYFQKSFEWFQEVPARIGLFFCSL